MSKLPLVSIIVPCYNHELYVQDTINSIIEQDYENIELIIIDDGSKDNSVEKIKEIEQKCLERFKRFEFRNRSNEGLSKTLNEGIEWCRGKYMSLIASDDIMLPSKTSKQVQYLEEHVHITSVSSNAEFIDNNGVYYKTSNFPEEEHHFEKIFRGNQLFAPSQMHHLAAVKSVGGFDEDLMIEDWSMWLKLAKNGYRIVLLGDALVQYRIHEHNMSGNFFKMKSAERQILDLYKDHPLYPEVIYQFSREEIKYYRDNGRRVKYYLLKIKLIFSKLLGLNKMHNDLIPKS